MLMAKERELIVEYGLRMLKDGLTVGTSGNLSVRVGEQHRDHTQRCGLRGAAAGGHLRHHD